MEEPLRREAYSLLELVIVLAILASLAGLAWPRVSPLLRRSDLREAALQLKAEFADARENAIRNGEIWECWLDPGTSYYALQPQQSTQEAPPNSASPRRSAWRPAQEDLPHQDATARALPGGVVFPVHRRVGRDSSPRMQSPHDVIETSVERRRPRGQARRAAQFYPDGRASNAVVRMMLAETGDSIELQLRGFTGGVTIGQVQRPSFSADRIDENPAPVASPQNTDSIGL